MEPDFHCKELGHWNLHFMHNLINWATIHLVPRYAPRADVFYAAYHCSDTALYEGTYVEGALSCYGCVVLWCCGAVVPWMNRKLVPPPDNNPFLQWWILLFVFLPKHLRCHTYLIVSLYPAYTRLYIHIYISLTGGGWWVLAGQTSAPCSKPAVKQNAIKMPVKCSSCFVW